MCGGRRSSSVAKSFACMLRLVSDNAMWGIEEKYYDFLLFLLVECIVRGVRWRQRRRHSVCKWNDFLNIAQKRWLLVRGYDDATNHALQSHKVSSYNFHWITYALDFVSFAFELYSVDGVFYVNINNKIDLFSISM